MSDRTYVCDLEDLPPGDRRIVTVDRREIGVLNVDGELYALSNVCPHQRGPVCEGAIKKAIDGEYVGPGKPIREFHSDVTTISCPYHGWEYDIETGQHVGDRRFSVPTFDVTVEDGAVYLEA